MNKSSEIEILRQHPDEKEKRPAGEWNRIVENSDTGYFTQLYEWMEICCQSFGFELYPLAKYEDNKLDSVFPLVYDPRKRELLSPPLTGIGGPAPITDLPSYLKKIRELASILDAQSIKIQVACNENTQKILKNFQYNTDHILPFYVLDLSNMQSFEEVKRKIYDRRARRGLKRSKNSGIEVVSTENNQNNAQMAYEIYQEIMVSRNVRNYLPGDLFEAIPIALNDYTIIFKALHNDKIAGIAICFVINKLLVTWFILGKTEARKLFVNYALYSHIIDYALSKHISMIDFGPSGVFTKANEIKMSHGGTPQWIATAVWMKNPINKIQYAFRKRLRKMAITHPQSRFSKIYQGMIERKQKR